MKEHKSTIVAAIVLTLSLGLALSLHFLVKPNYASLSSSLHDAKYGDVISEAERRLIYRPGDKELIHVLIEAYLGQATVTNDPKWQNKAISLINSSIKKYPNDAELYLQQGYYYTLANASNRAQIAFEKSAKLDPQNSLVWSALGSVYESRKEYSKAALLYRRAIKLNYNDPVANVAAVRSLYRIDKDEAARIKAIKFLNTTESVMAKASLFEMLGLDAIKSNDKTKAKIYLKKALAITPMRPISLAAYATILYEEANNLSPSKARVVLEEAESMALLATNVEPEYAYAYALLSRIAMLQGKASESSGYADQVRKYLASDDLTTEDQKENLKTSFATSTSSIGKVQVISIKKLEAMPEGVKEGITIVKPK